MKSRHGLVLRQIRRNLIRITDIAECDVFFGTLGVLVNRDLPSAQGAAAVEVDAGFAGGFVFSLHHQSLTLPVWKLREFRQAKASAAQTIQGLGRIDGQLLFGAFAVRIGAVRPDAKLLDIFFR